VDFISKITSMCSSDRIDYWRDRHIDIILAMKIHILAPLEESVS